MKLLKYEQKDKWSCGAACLKVALDHFGIKKEIDELIKELKTTKSSGTEHSNIIRLLKKSKLKFEVKKNGTLEDLKRSLKDSLIVVDYWLPYHKESHYSIVKRIGADRIHFHDTYFGPNHSYKIDYFLKNWKDQEGTGWFLSIKRVKLDFRVINKNVLRS